MLWLLLSACVGEDEVLPHCEDYPVQAEALPSAVLDWETDCGNWILAVDEWVAISVMVTDETTTWEIEADEALDPRDPAYTNMSNDVAKRTFQTYGVAATDGEPVALDITCADGNAWSGRFVVID